ncbi:MAG: molybdopterin-guanine dinucleotide biosynthesis protein B [wastewater metagenome]|nr:molybdopterin-guanine dinucleotide biosynthesis protein B [Candidatus Loosdrechtia aerotolerans]
MYYVTLLELQNKQHLPKYSKDIPVISIIGKQNAGKTTLIQSIVPILKKKGYRVGTIKYRIPHFEIDYEGKDTYKHYQAGADVVSISSPEKLAVIKRITRNHPPIQDIVRQNYSDVDIVLVEGYKKCQYPYIEIHGNQVQMKSIHKEYQDHVKIVSKMQTGSPVPTFHKKDLNKIIKFIELNIVDWR